MSNLLLSQRVFYHALVSISSTSKFRSYKLVARSLFWSFISLPAFSYCPGAHCRVTPMWSTRATGEFLHSMKVTDCVLIHLTTFMSMLPTDQTNCLLYCPTYPTAHDTTISQEKFSKTQTLLSSIYVCVVFLEKKYLCSNDNETPIYWRSFFIQYNIFLL